MKNLFRLGFRFVAFASVLMAAFSTSAFAQEAAEAVAPQEQTMLDKWIIAGGWTMIPIMLVEAFIIFLVIYNMVALKKEKFCPEDLKVTLLQLMAECRIRSAIEVAAGSPTYLGRLVAYALPNAKMLLKTPWPTLRPMKAVPCSNGSTCWPFARRFLPCSACSGRCRGWWARSGRWLPPARRTPPSWPVTFPWLF